MSYKISLLHATRGRSQQALAARDKWLNTADNPNDVEHIFGIDDDDLDSLTNISTTRVIVPRGKGCVAAWNACAAKSQGDILMQMSDDWEPFQGWDTVIINEFADTTPNEERVIAISDGTRTDNLLCMAILNRARYVKQGYLFYPKFFSVFSDNYFTWEAERDKVIKDAKHIVIQHMHPLWGKGQWDKTYADSNAPINYQNGHMLFNELTRVNNAKICLAMIVKDEFDTIEKCLTSVKDHISYWVICDTGSTDGTQDLIKKLMSDSNIPGELHERPWVDFAYNRTESLKLAKGKADYIMVIDADDHLVTNGGEAMLKNLKHDQYHIKIEHGGLTYYRPQIIRDEYDWSYAGVLHEFLDPPKDVKLLPPVVLPHLVIKAAASEARGGFSGKKKYIHDALILEKALLAEDLDPGMKIRYTFYLAQSYRDAGEHARALAAYEARVELGGWEEEVYYSKYMIARLKILLKCSDADAINALTQAWEYRPSRVDALYDLIRFLGEKGRFTLAYAFATIGIRIPPTKDVLFVRQDLTHWRMIDDYSILAYKTGNKQEAIKAATAITSSPHFMSIPENERVRISANLEMFKAPDDFVPQTTVPEAQK